MLHVEYEKHQTPIADLSITDANIWLKDQIHKFLSAVYPFDQDLCLGESAYQWWTKIAQMTHNYLRYVIH